LASSPPTYEHTEAANSSGKLPKLEEELAEPEDDYDMLEEEVLSPCLCTFWSHFCQPNKSNDQAGDVEFCAHQGFPYDSSSATLPPSSPYDLAEGFFGDDDHGSLQMAKRRRSGDSPVNSIAVRIENRFPSLSKRLREKKRTSVFGQRTPSAASRTASRAHSTRSSSLTSSVAPVLEQIELQMPPTPTRSVCDDQEDVTASTPAEIITLQEIDYEPIDRRAMASTPLLPPTMVNNRPEEETPLQSPLQSPTVADLSQAFSYVNTPRDTPQLPSMPTPPLSTRPSVSSFKPGHMVPSSEIPSIMIADPDEWSMKLGHANFTIYPEPYVPEVCDTATCRQLFADWEQARCNFTKHQVRTGEHFGVTSKTYVLTEQKWAEIDAQWKKNYDSAVAKAMETSPEPVDSTPIEPAPLSKMPSLNDPKSEGKFPKLGDEDIVGPMVQIASQFQYKQSKKRAFLKFFNDIKFPSSFLGRSSTVFRSTR